MRPPKRLVERIVAPLRWYHKITISVSYRLHGALSKLPWRVVVSCNRPVWPNAGIRGGKSTEFVVGHCRSKEAAHVRANALLLALDRVRKKGTKS